jgi:phthalate 4,5-cis-dihydrodiol dehydrogenase
VQLAAAADLREHALAAFREEFGGRMHGGIERLVDDADVDAVWVASPSHLHARHAIMAMDAGKHVVVEKPFAVTLEECDAMIDASRRNHVALLSGGARSYEPAVLAMRRVITSGRLGGLRALADWSFTSFMTRAREQHELDMSIGGGAVYNQGPHVLDVLRLLGGGMVRSVRAAMVDTQLQGRPCPGYFTAFLEFADGTPATFTYNGYGYVQNWEFPALGRNAGPPRCLPGRQRLPPRPA